VGQFALRKAQAGHAPPSSLALQSAQRHKEPPESLFVLRASLSLQYWLPDLIFGTHRGARSAQSYAAPRRHGLSHAVRRAFAVLSHVGGWRLDWLAGAGGFEPLHSGNQHALVYLPDLSGNVSSLGHSGPQCCTAVMPQNDPNRSLGALFCCAAQPTCCCARLRSSAQGGLGATASDYEP
jgi:hypothetical protein